MTYLSTLRRINIINPFVRIKYSTNFNLTLTGYRNNIS